MKALPSGTDRNQRAFTAVVLAAVRRRGARRRPGRSRGRTDHRRDSGELVYDHRLRRAVRPHGERDERHLERRQRPVSRSRLGTSRSTARATRSRVAARATASRSTGQQNPVTNVTVERLHANGWTVGVFVLDVDDSTVENVVANGTISGVALAQSGGNRILDVTAYDNSNRGRGRRREQQQHGPERARGREQVGDPLRARERQQRRAQQHRAQQLELGLLLDAQSRAERGLEPAALDGHALVHRTERRVPGHHRPARAPGRHREPELVRPDISPPSASPRSR